MPGATFQCTCGTFWYMTAPGDRIDAVIQASGIMGTPRQLTWSIPLPPTLAPPPVPTSATLASMQAAAASMQASASSFRASMASLLGNLPAVPTYTTLGGFNPVIAYTSSVATVPLPFKDGVFTEPLRVVKRAGVHYRGGKLWFIGCGMSVPYLPEDTARCAHIISQTKAEHPSPAADCSCGFYSTKTAAQLDYSAALFLLDAELLGRAVICKEGYRAEKQRVLGVWAPTLCGACTGRSYPDDGFQLTINGGGAVAMTHAKCRELPGYPTLTPSAYPMSAYTSRSSYAGAQVIPVAEFRALLSPMELMPAKSLPEDLAAALPLRQFTRIGGRNPRNPPAWVWGQTSRPRRVSRLKVI